MSKSKASLHSNSSSFSPNFILLTKLFAVLKVRSLALLTLVIAVATASLTSDAASGSRSYRSPAPTATSLSVASTRATERSSNSRRNASHVDAQPAARDGLKIARKGHTASVLPDGNIFIVGGENSTGTIGDSESYDPAARASSLSAKLKTPRADHSATTLGDGRILVIGGHNSEGALRSTEIFDPSTGSFTEGPSLHRARSGHTATVLPDGKILIAGGDSAGTAEILDPETMKFTRAASLLNGPRSAHSAILLKNGSVLIAGGISDNGKPVKGGEILDPETLQFTSTRNEMLAARTRPTLVELPDGKVQVIGGDDQGSMEMFNAEGRYFTARARLVPESDSKTSVDEVLRTQSRAALIGNHLLSVIDKESYGPSRHKRSLFLTDPVERDLDLSTLLDRSGHTITELPGSRSTVVAGGVSSSGMTLMSTMTTESSPATVTTDKTDYHPGETVTITGTNWLPGETVNLTLHRNNDSPDTFLSSVADDAGNITNSDYLVQESDLDVTFLLTGVGETSGFSAQTTFTDRNPQSVTIGTQSPNPVNPGNSATYTVTVTFGGNDNSCTVTLSVTGLPTGATFAFSPDNTPTDSGSSGQVMINRTLQINTTASGPSATPPGTYSFTITGTRGDGCQGSGNLTTTGQLVVANACTAPTLSACPANINTQTSSDGTGDCSTTVTYAPPTVTGGTSPVSLNCSPPSGSSFSKGTTTVTCTATNSCGSATCSITVNVADNEAPVLSGCTNLQKNTSDDGTGNCSTTVFYNPTANDNCDGTTSVTCTPPSGSSFSKGVTAVNCASTDAAANTGHCSFNVSVVDNEAPVLSGCTNLTRNTSDDGKGNCSTTVTFTPSATDNCDGATTVVCTPPSGSVFNKGVTAVSCNSTDSSSNTGSCSFNVTVVDDEVPILSGCSSLTRNTSDDGNGNCSTTVTYSPSAADNCDGATTVVCTPPSGSIFNKGVTAVSCNSTDSSSNTGSCSFNVTVVDNEAPTLSGCTTITKNTSDDGTGNCSTAVSYAPSANDNCDGITSVVCTPPSGSVFSKGTTSVSCTSTDSSSNIGNCSFNVIVVDDEAPILSGCTNLNRNTNDDGTGNCSTTVTYSLSATDNCDGTTTVVCTPPSGAVFSKGVNPVSCNTTDAALNTSSCSFNVTVIDNEAPILTGCVNISKNTSADGAGNCSSVVAYSPTATDNCDSVATVVCTPPSGSVFNKGTTSVSCTSTDSSSNIGSCSFNVTVVDDEAPVIAGCANITAHTSDDGTGNCSTTVNFSASATDNCDGVTAVICSPASGSVFDKGTTTVNCNSVDATGNSGSCTFNVSVLDDEAPAFSGCTDVTAHTSDDGLGNCSAKVSYNPTANDNCDGSRAVSCTPPSGTVFEKGVTPVNCTAADAAGNPSSCNFNVKVVDDEAPILSGCTNITKNTSDDGAGNCSATVTFSPTASDNCDSSTSVTCVPPSGSSFGKGITAVTCSSTDRSYNTGSCSFNVTIKDNEAPVLTGCTNITRHTSDDGTGNCSTTVSFSPSATDNCEGVIAVVCSPASGSVFNKGVTSVTCNATDSSSNSASCSFNVMVVDNEAPSCTVPANITTSCTTSAGGAVVSYSASVTDNCPGATISCTPPSGSTFSTGTTTVNCTATDTSSNTSTCNFTVTVGYNFLGFFQPVDNAPAFNGVKAGQSVPLKFQLTCGGNFISDLSAVTSIQVAYVPCAGGDAGDLIPADDSGYSGLHYDFVANQFIYSWKTEKSWANSCRKIVLALKDGSVQEAYFQFKK